MITGLRPKECIQKEGAGMETENIERTASNSELIRRCTAEEWHEAYKARLIERGIDVEFAQSTLEAGMDDFDYDDSPADAADMELSCWIDL